MELMVNFLYVMAWLVVILTFAELALVCFVLFTGMAIQPRVGKGQILLFVGAVAWICCVLLGGV